MNFPQSPLGGDMFDGLVVHDLNLCVRDRVLYVLRLLEVYACTAETLKCAGSKICRERGIAGHRIGRKQMLRRERRREEVRERNPRDPQGPNRSRGATCPKDMRLSQRSH